MTNLSVQERRRIETGIQCPECWGVSIDCRYSRFDSQPEGFLCTDCGCQWSKPLYGPRDEPILPDD